MLLHYDISLRFAIIVITVSLTGKESKCDAFSIRTLLSSDVDAPHPIIIGEPISLTCNPPNIDQDDSKVEWIKDGEEDNILVTDEQYKVFNDNKTLLIISADQDDAGTYECRTKSPRPLSKQFSAFFFKLENLPETRCAVQGGNITLTCLAEGKPIPTVQWLKDGQKLNDSKYDYKPNKHYISNAVLSFENVGQSDAGNYTCQVFSDMGVENTFTKVNVEGTCSSDSGSWIGSFLGGLCGVIVFILLLVLFVKRVAITKYLKDKFKS